MEMKSSLALHCRLQEKSVVETEGEGEERGRKVRKQIHRTMLLHSQDAQLQWLLFVHRAADWYHTLAQPEAKPATVGRAVASCHSRCAHIPTVV